MKTFLRDVGRVSVRVREIIAKCRHCAPELRLLDTGAVSSEWEERCLAVPKGQARIAQRFNAGLDAKRSRVP